MIRARKQPTTTILVEEFLRNADDFVTMQMFIDGTGESPNRVSAALHHLRKCHVVDVIIEPDGRGWWFVRPEVDDQRSRRVVERTPEAKPRRTRRTAKKGADQ